MTAVQQVIAAAQEGARKLSFAKAGGENLELLAEQFDATNGHSWRQRLFGGASKAAHIVEKNDAFINDAVARVGHNKALANHVVPAELVQGIMFVENNYNGGDLGFSRSALPMNINYADWKPLLAAQKPPITENDVKHDPAKNILAATLILSTIDAAIEPGIVGRRRWALVASMYGNTDVTMQAGRSIMYGAKVEQVCEERYPIPFRTQSIADLKIEAQHPVTETLMNLIPPLPPFPELASGKSGQHRL